MLSPPVAMKPMGVEMYEGLRTPSISSNFTASSASPNLGPSVSAREAYEGLSRTPNWSEDFSRRFTDAEDEENDDYPSLITSRNESHGISRDSSFTIWSEYSVQSLPAAAEGPSFESADIERITYGFRWLIGGSGLIWTFYRGKLMDGTDVSVKVFSREICYKTELFSRFKWQIQQLMTIKHKNLLGVIGYCFEGKNNALVMEPLPPGKLRSLAERDGEDEPLTWVQRFQIAVDVAEALKYLHNDCNPPIIHGNVNIENILLDEGLNARLGDCGFSKAVYEVYPASSFARCAFAEPSYIINHYMKESCDVYDFGIVLWNLITHHQPSAIQTSLSQNVRLFRWSRPSVAGATNAKLAYGAPWRQGTSDSESTSKAIEKATKIVDSCTFGYSDVRPTMAKVVTKLKGCLRSLQLTSPPILIGNPQNPGLPPKPKRTPRSQNFQAR